MTVDEGLLDRLRRFEDPVSGTVEELIQPRLGGLDTFGMLIKPVRKLASIGWVICHSFGIEQIHLGRLEVMTARAFAAAGYPVLRYHGQGYGESQGSIRDVTLSTHLADAADAVELMRSQEGVERIGLIGARFGGLVAGLVAQASRVSDLVLWEPVVEGARFIGDLFRQRAMAAIAAGTKGGPTIKDMREEVATKGSADLGGMPLSRQAVEGISAVNLLTDVREFGGRALILGVSPSEAPRPELVKLAEHLREVGGRPTVRSIQDRGGFGRFRFEDGDEVTAKADTQIELAEKLAEVTLAWASEEA